MKISQLKKIIKEAVKEAIQEEMKDILLEAVKVPKTIVETKKSTTPQFEQQKVNGPVDTTSANGTLPAGNVSMDQIMGLMNSK